MSKTIDVFTKIVLHIASWIILNCIALGAYHLYLNCQSFLAKQQDMGSFVQSLTTEEKNELASVLFAVGEKYEAKK